MGVDVAVGPVLAQVGRVNMMFALGQAVCAPGRRRLDQAGLSEAVVAGEVERTRAQLAALSGTAAGQVEWRVAASLFHQGLAARVLSPVLVAALCHGAGIQANRLHWDPERASGSIALATDQGRATRVPEGAQGGAADWVGRSVLDPDEGVLGRVEAALAGVGRISPRLLRGNAASALVGAVGALGVQLPRWRRAGQELAGELLARPGLDLSGSCAGPAGQGRFTRTTCCLYYRLGGGGLCGDCVLGRSAPALRRARG